jgi:hypothetical protein
MAGWPIAVLTVVACRSGSTASVAPAAPESDEVHVLGLPPNDAGAVDATPPDCVGLLHVVANRGLPAANATRFVASNSATAIFELEPDDLGAFCDWEACVRTNGYGHTCWLNDAGWERCRVCDGGDCDGGSTSRVACVAHARDPGRATCQVALLEECVLQRGLLGPADSTRTETCVRSDNACAGQLAGDPATMAVEARHETDAVTATVAEGELARAARLQPDSSFIGSLEQNLAALDAGFAPTVDAGDGAP